MDKIKKYLRKELVEEGLPNLFAFAALAGICGGIYYFSAHRGQYPWYAIPLAIAAGGTFFGLLELLNIGVKGNDLTSYMQGAEGLVIIVLAYLIAGSLVIGHFL